MRVSVKVESINDLRPVTWRQPAVSACVLAIDLELKYLQLHITALVVRATCKL